MWRPGIIHLGTSSGSPDTQAESLLHYAALVHLFSSIGNLLLAPLKQGQACCGEAGEAPEACYTPKYRRRVYIEQGLLAWCLQKAEV